MLAMSFVNLRGEAVSLTPVKPPPKVRAPQSAFHQGWLVMGYSPAQVSAAQQLHETTSRNRQQHGLAALPSFDLRLATRGVRPVKVRSKPYEVYEAACECAALARRAGWGLVQVTPKAKGVA